MEQGEAPLLFTATCQKPRNATMNVIAFRLTRPSMVAAELTKTMPMISDAKRV
ncbi:MAG: hypothetical protein M3032_04455 [Verrucomicrobiota bacterium]|nr:hypothetical protein [Verrucomicrobiota bacterium]